MRISFKVDTLAELREACRRALDKRATKMRGLNHAHVISIYCNDPEENTLEVCLDTPWYVESSRMVITAADVDKPDTEIWAETERIAKADSTFVPLAEWAARFEARQRTL